MNPKERRKNQTKTDERRRAHDVVIYQSNDDWVVFDSQGGPIQEDGKPRGICYNFDTEAEAVEYFKSIKLAHREARLI